MRLLLTFLLLPFSFTAYSQEKQVFFGFGAGPETIISGILPKVSYFKFIETKKLNSFYGIEGTIWGVGAVWFAGDISYGIKRKVFTFESSLGYWNLPKQKPDGPNKIGPHTHLTLNPKIGIKFWTIWLKTGPSFILAKSYSSLQGIELADLTRIGGLRLNVELLINIY